MGLLTYLKPGGKPKAQTNEKAASSSSGASTDESKRSSSAVNRASRPASSFPMGDMVKHDVMITHLYQQILQRMWVSDAYEEGIVLKRSKDDFLCLPADLREHRAGLYDAVRALNVRCAMTLNTRVIKLFLAKGDMAYIPLDDDLRLQVLPSIEYIPRCQKHHFAAFIQDRGTLVVWDDDPTHIIQRASEIEEAMLKMVWNDSVPGDESKMTSKRGSRAPSVMIQELPEGVDIEEAAMVQEPPRKIMLLQALLCALTLMILIAAMGAGWRNITQEVMIDKSYLRCAILIVIPLQMWLALFFMQSVTGCCMQMIGPIAQMGENTKYYSGTPSPRIRGTLPHVTIQCPVYKEGLTNVIDPTVRSVKEAISTYEMQGGTANIFVNDDGMQLIPEEEAQIRREYYEENNIGWVSRPAHDPKGEKGGVAFTRAGKFKKASNMNYALNVSARIEDRLAIVPRHEKWTIQDESEVYEEAFAQVIEEDQGRTWAGGNVRVGDYILLIDSDTRVPADCFLDAVSEMEQGPQVAIIQFSSGVMNVTTSFFEKGITFFTNLIYTAIRYAVACGDVAPFVGHNAFLRWSAVQDVAFEEDGVEKFWSEATVSEDFDMALRLQSEGYLVRFAAYTGGDFKEGVSLTVYDELARWEKYAYGCNELIFHPLRYWPMRGPFTKLFRRFIGSKMPLPSKLTIMAYIGTYYALASTWIFVILNYFLLGWFNGYLDHYYIDSFKIYFSIIVVFTGLGNVSLAVLRYRTAEKPLLSSLVENFTWIPLLTVFLGGVSLHVSQAILSHMFSVDMSWGATAKEATETSFFEEIPKVLKKFKGTFGLCLVLIIGMIVLAGVGPLGQMVPYDLQIKLFPAIWPLAMMVATHVLLPIVLNPGLMLFTW